MPTRMKKRSKRAKRARTKRSRRISRRQRTAGQCGGNNKYPLPYPPRHPRSSTYTRPQHKRERVYIPPNPELSEIVKKTQAAHVGPRLHKGSLWAKLKGRIR